MLVALRAAASPALRAWIDANIEDVLAAAAPAFLATADPKLLKIVEGLRRQVSAQPATKYIGSIADALGVTVTPGTKILPVDLTQWQAYIAPSDYADLVADAGLAVETVVPVTTAVSVWSKKEETITYERRKAGADKRASWYDQREQYTGPGLQLSGEASARVPGVYVSGPGLPLMFFYWSEMRWAPNRRDAARGDDAAAVPVRKLLTLDPKPEKQIPGLLWDVLGVEALRPLASALLGELPLAEVKKQRERERRAALLRDTTRGSCPVCFRPTALSGRLIAAHGYRMAGGGWGAGHRGMFRVGGACAGTSQPPWETSPEGAAKYAIRLRQYVVTAQENGARADDVRNASAEAERYENAVQQWPSYPPWAT
jgi:hypothetical protein